MLECSNRSSRTPERQRQRGKQRERHGIEDEVIKMQFVAVTCYTVLLHCLVVMHMMNTLRKAFQIFIFSKTKKRKSWDSWMQRRMTSSAQSKLIARFGSEQKWSGMVFNACNVADYVKPFVWWNFFAVFSSFFSSFFWGRGAEPTREGVR